MPATLAFVLKLEHCWGAEEQVLLLLAFCPHPQYIHVANDLLGQYWRSSPVSLFHLMLGKRLGRLLRQVVPRRGCEGKLNCAADV